MFLKGALFKNNYKEKDNQPDMRGDVRDESGKQFRIAGWKRQDKNGNDYLSAQIEDMLVNVERTEGQMPAQPDTDKDTPSF